MGEQRPHRVVHASRNLGRDDMRVRKRRMVARLTDTHHAWLGECATQRYLRETFVGRTHDDLGADANISRVGDRLGG